MACAMSPGHMAQPCRGAHKPYTSICGDMCAECTFWQKHREVVVFSLASASMCLCAVIPLIREPRVGQTRRQHNTCAALGGVVADSALRSARILWVCLGSVGEATELSTHCGVWRAAPRMQSLRYCIVPAGGDNMRLAPQATPWIAATLWVAAIAWAAAIPWQPHGRRRPHGLQKRHELRPSYGLRHLGLRRTQGRRQLDGYGNPMNCGHAMACGDPWAATIPQASAIP